MTVQRILYVTQESLSVWETQGSTEQPVAVFADDDQGLRQFDEYVANAAHLTSAMLVDVIEEEFRLQSIPKLSRRDRRSLVQRRCAAAFRRTPYRVSQFQGPSGREPGQFDVVHSAIVNHELLDPWLQVLLRHRTPLSGVYSVPHLANRLVKRLFPKVAHSLFIAPHQGNRLRQVFTQDGRLRSARLSQSPTQHEREYPDAVVAEAGRSRRYFERVRMMSPLDLLDVRVVADEKVAARILELAGGNDAVRYTFVDPDVAVRKLGCAQPVPRYRFEQVYFSFLARRQPSRSYAASGETRYWHMRRIRSGLIGAAVAAAAVCSAFAAILLADTWMLRQQAAEFDAQVRQLSESYRRENQSFNPIRADSSEMKLAVDSGDYILAQRVPVPWVMNQVGAVLGDFPDILAQELAWAVESPPYAEQRQRPGEPRPPVPVPAVNAVEATLTGVVEPFDGDLRRAFARIDALAGALEARTHFSTASVIEYPIDTSPAAAVSGEIAARQPDEAARFRILIRYRPGPSGEGGSDDSV